MKESNSDLAKPLAEEEFVQGDASILNAPALFDLALSEMGEARVKQFERFIDYKVRAKATGKYGTQASISVQSVNDLAPELKNHKTMVFRCGTHGGGTRFALAKAQSWPGDYFIEDKLFDENPRTFLSSAPMRELFSFSLLKPVERTLVNLALTSGGLATALNLDDPKYASPGATGSSAYSFKFRPHSSDETVIDHQAGQVDIDLLFIAQRENRDIVFVVEAKYEHQTETSSPIPKGSLAKHKLLFPVLAVMPQVPEGIEIVPVYLKAVLGKGIVDLHIAECKPYRGREHKVACVNTVEMVRKTSLRLPLHFAGTN